MDAVDRLDSLVTRAAPLTSEMLDALLPAPQPRAEPPSGKPQVPLYLRHCRRLTPETQRRVVALVDRGGIEAQLAVTLARGGMIQTLRGFADWVARQPGGRLAMQPLRLELAERWLRGPRLRVIVDEVLQAPGRASPAADWDDLVAAFAGALRLVSVPGVSLGGYTSSDLQVLVNAAALSALGDVGKPGTLAHVRACLVAIHEFAHFARRFGVDAPGDSGALDLSCAGVRCRDAGEYVELRLAGAPLSVDGATQAAIEAWDGHGPWPVSAPQRVRVVG